MCFCRYHCQPIEEYVEHFLVFWKRSDHREWVKRSNPIEFICQTQKSAAVAAAYAVFHDNVEARIFNNGTKFVACTYSQSYGYNIKFHSFLSLFLIRFGWLMCSYAKAVWNNDRKFSFKSHTPERKRKENNTKYNTTSERKGKEEENTLSTKQRKRWKN